MKEMKNSKKTYMIPMVEIMSARVEKGFAGSNENPNTPTGNGGLGHIDHNENPGQGNNLDFVD